MKISNHIPNALTLCNMLCGMLALLYVFQDNFYATATCLSLAALFDVLDGLAARILHAQSNLGRELDSLSDLLSFGVVPACIMTAMIQESQGLSFPPLALSPVYFFAGIALALAAALRLAIFNLDTRPAGNFYGLPTPANALLVLSYWFLGKTETFPLLHNVYFLCGLCLLSCALMLSSLPLIHLKFNGVSWNKNWYRYLTLAVGVTVPALKGWKAVPWLMLLYIVFSLAVNLIERKRVK